VIVDRQLIFGEKKVQNGECILNVDRQLIVGEDKVLHGDFL
jgi:hypothetical protein